MAYVLVVLTRTNNGAATITTIPAFASEASAVTAGNKLQNKLTTRDVPITYTVVTQ